MLVTFNIQILKLARRYLIKFLLKKRNIISMFNKYCPVQRARPRVCVTRARCLYSGTILFHPKKMSKFVSDKNLLGI